jgi:hypothetical protein
MSMWLRMDGISATAHPKVLMGMGLARLGRLVSPGWAKL